MKNSIETIQIEDTSLKEDIDFQNKLVVWNDDFTTFDTVIAAFCSVLKHSSEQAEQCAFIIHTKGKYCVKSGSYSELKPYKDALNNFGLEVTIEESD